MDSAARRSQAWLVVAGVLVVGAASCWRLWEQDIWWQIRAGHDLVTSWRFPTGDQWSYTSQGSNWKNIQWLSTVLLWGTHAVLGVPGLILLRGVLAAALTLLVARFARRVSGDMVVALALMPVVWLACAYRLQVRPDTFVILTFALLVDLWTSNASAGRQRAGSVGLIVLAANLHAGTAPIVACAAVAFLAASWRSPRDLGWLIAFGAACLLTPYPIEAMGMVWGHFTEARFSTVPNPDIRQLSWSRFLIHRYGFTAVAWALLVGLALLVRVAPANRVPRLAAVWRRGPWLALALLGLGVMSIQADRIIPYAAILAAPAVAALVAQVARPSIAVVTWLLVPVQLLLFPARWGFGEDERIDPVVAVAWIHEQRPEPNILHLAGEGNYLLGHAPEYPVFIDTRAAPYLALEKTYVTMVNEPEVMAEVIQRWNINTVLLPNTWFHVPYNGGSRRAAFLPKREWALVHFDAGWTVLVRRTPAHARLISAHEYEYLVPYLAADNYVRAFTRTAESDLRLKRELQRCLVAWPNSPFCETVTRVVFPN